MPSLGHSVLYPNAEHSVCAWCMGYSNSEYQTSQPDLKNTFGTAQMKKLFHLIQNNNPSQDITTLDNLDELIKSALGNGRKKLVNEEKFYRFFLNMA